MSTAYCSKDGGGILVSIPSPSTVVAICAWNAHSSLRRMICFKEGVNDPEPGHLDIEPYTGAEDSYTHYFGGMKGDRRTKKAASDIVLNALAAIN